VPTAKLKALYKRVGPTLFARAQRVLKNDAQAQDAVQQVVIELSRMGDLKDTELLTFGRRILAKHLEKKGGTLDSMSPHDEK
jgi:DNA-directed RNA polymerase specialized sigma24 family protein